MSLFSKIAKGAKKLIGSAGKIGGIATAISTGGIGAGAAALGSTLLSKAAKKAAKKAARKAGGAIATVLPGVGEVKQSLPALVTGAAGGLVGDILWDDEGKVMMRKRRRRKGITARDLSSFKRVARLVDKYSKPVGKMRNYKPKKEF